MRTATVTNEDRYSFADFIKDGAALLSLVAFVAAFLFFADGMIEAKGQSDQDVAISYGSISELIADIEVQ